VSDPSPLLDRAALEDAFRRLGERLASRGVVADLYVFGGAAMALAYEQRRSQVPGRARRLLTAEAVVQPALRC
jgi:hypothetical protein